MNRHKRKIIVLVVAELLLLLLVSLYLCQHFLKPFRQIDASSVSGIIADSIEETIPAFPTGAEDAVDIDIIKDFRPGFVHGNKEWMYQKYIVLHDTEDNSTAQSIIDWWDSNGNKVATHFIVNKDGSIYQCVPLNKIAHHVGYGNTGNNEKYGVQDETRDDKIGTGEPDAGVTDYGMNSYSIGIEMVHVGGEGDYPEAQLESLDKLIEYIDGYYGFDSEIIDHKAWRKGNSDTSPEFEEYLNNYKKYRKHK